jgi:hypothetical protein
MVVEPEKVEPPCEFSKKCPASGPGCSQTTATGCSEFLYRTGKTVFSPGEKKKNN